MTCAGLPRTSPISGSGGNGDVRVEIDNPRKIASAMELVGQSPGGQRARS